MLLAGGQGRTGFLSTTPTPDPTPTLDLPPELEARLVSDGILTTYWPTVIAVVIAAALVCWWLLRRREARRPKLRATAYLAGTVITLLVGAVFGVNTWAGYLPDWNAVGEWTGQWLGGGDSLATEGHAVPTQAAGEPDGDRTTTSTTGAVSRVTIASTSAGVPDSPAWIFVPPDYDKPGNDERYPVVYLLHGAPGTGADWFTAGDGADIADILIDGGYLPPCIIVSPDLNAGGTAADQEAVNYPAGGPQLESFVEHDVVSWVDAHLRTRADRGHRVIGGMSAGGAEALNFALHRPEQFGGVIAIMAYSEPYSEQLLADPTAAAEYRTTDLIKKVPSGTTLPVYLAAGELSPSDLKDNVELERALRAAGQPVIRQEFSGETHDWTMARRAIPYGLLWISQELSW